MGAVWARILQRTIPAIKEQQKILKSLQNENIIKEQEIVKLKEQKDLIEKHVGVLTTELTAAQIIIQELRFRLDTRRKLILVGLGVGAVGAGLVWLYMRRHADIREEDQEEVDVLQMRVDIPVPDSLECIICMEGMKEVMMEPCGHVCCCRSCAVRLMTNDRLRCPVCRGRADIRTVFIS